LIDEGTTGFLVERGDASSAAERVLRLLEDEELRKTLGCAGRRKTEEKFNLQTNVGELIRVYGISRQS
jgi:phosphatidylinositol alpha-1,6-mannosyltransferase